MPSAAEVSARRTWLNHLGDQRDFDRSVSVILLDAADEADRIVTNTLSNGVSRARMKITQAELRRASNGMWQKVSAEMSSAMQTSIRRGVEGVLEIDTMLMQATGRISESMVMAARHSADIVASRLINDIPLSPSVYRTQALSNKWVDKVINRHLALNSSARDIALDVRRFINPKVRGGVSYAAKRLGRTEINNAFHTSTIRASQDHPWTVGFKWNLSGSHPRPDVCNDYADDDHDGLGSGVFKKGNAPGKPHPQCLCYLGVVNVDEDEFVNKLVSGKFNKFLKAQGMPSV